MEQTPHGRTETQALLRDIDLDALVAALPTYTAAGRESLIERLSNPLSDPLEIQKRQAQIKGIKTRTASTVREIKDAREALREAEADVNSVATASGDTRHAEYYTQILWSADSRFAWLNELGWLTELIVFLRTLFLPGLAILLPLFVFLAPLIFYNLVLKKPLTLNGYFDLLQSSIKKAMPSVLGKPRFAGTGGVFELGEQFVHVGISVAMFGASIWNQISAAISMRSVVADMRRRANAVRTFAAATVRLGEALGVAVDPSVSDVEWRPADSMTLFGKAWNTPSRIAALLAEAGRLDMLAAIATAKRTCFPKHGSTMSIKDLFHPGLKPNKRIYNSLTMDGSAARRNHVLLTGPNRGGKSTLLKALGCAVLMSQTVGVVFARSATLPVFDHIITALSPQDVVGKMSLFEAEIEFAKQVRARVGQGTMFLMMDEIFHGTNAHDGVEASQVFLDELYDAAGSVFSVVSTHYMDLPTRYGADKRKQSQNLCMEASVDPNDPDRLIYTYRLREGVNRFSSVREILRERGLLKCVSSAEKTPVDASKV